MSMSKNKLPKVKLSPKFYEDMPETQYSPETGGMGHGNNPARREIFLLRMSLYEKNELILLGRSYGCSGSYMVRRALEAAYPKIFIDTNHNIRKPRKPKPIQPRTTIMTSMATGEKKVIVGNLSEQDLTQGYLDAR